MKVIIDRFEGKYAVCEKEDKEMMDIDRGEIPLDAKEGDVLIIDGNTITIDKDATEERRKRIQALMDDLWN
jgi:hypothetical protein